MNKMEIDIAHRNFSGIKSLLMERCAVRHRLKDNLISVLEVVEFYSFWLRSLARVKIISSKKTSRSKFGDKNPMNTLHNTP